VPDRKFDLGDYVEVKDRIARFYELYGNGRLVTEGYQLTTEPDDKPKVIVTAAAYRSPDDTHPARGNSWMYLPGTTNYTRGSEIENAETSAWGRAIAALGILTEKSIASIQEIANKEQGEQPERTSTNGGLVGIVERGDKQSSDFELRQTPDGYRLGFRLKDGRSGILVEASDALAESLAAIRELVVGQRVTCFGTIASRTFTAGKDKREITYQALALTRILTPDFDLPASSTAVGGPSEAPEAQVAAAGHSESPVAAAPDELDALPLFAEPLA
jgi:hypothetical protein